MLRVVLGGGEVLYGVTYQRSEKPHHASFLHTLHTNLPNRRNGQRVSSRMDHVVQTRADFLKELGNVLLQVRFVGEIAGVA